MGNLTCIVLEGSVETQRCNGLKSEDDLQACFAHEPSRSTMSKAAERRVSIVGSDLCALAVIVKRASRKVMTVKRMSKLLLIL
jgi:hypothetical protein